MTTEDDFQAALDAHPEDWQTRMVFADWLEERGDARAEGYRALGVLRVEPWLYLGGPLWGFFSVRRDWLHNRKTRDSQLPHDWVGVDGFLGVNGQGGYENLFTANYATRRTADDAAAFAFLLLPSSRRAELLTSPSPA